MPWCVYTHVCAGHEHVHVYVICAGVCVYMCSGVCTRMCAHGHEHVHVMCAGVCVCVCTRVLVCGGVCGRQMLLFQQCGGDISEGLFLGDRKAASDSMPRHLTGPVWTLSLSLHHGPSKQNCHLPPFLMRFVAPKVSRSLRGSTVGPGLRP